MAEERATLSEQLTNLESLLGKNAEAGFVAGASEEAATFQQSFEAVVALWKKLVAFEDVSCIPPNANFSGGLTSAGSRRDSGSVGSFGLESGLQTGIYNPGAGGGRYGPKRFSPPGVNPA